MSQPIEMGIEITAKGANATLDRLEQRIKELGKLLTDGRKTAEDAERKAKEASGALANAQGAITSLGRLAALGVAGSTLLVRSHAQAGFAGTLQGQQSEVYGQLLNRQLAAVFAPLLEEKTRYVNEITQWLRQLDEPKRESIRTMAMFTLSMTAMGAIVPRVTRGLAAMVTSNEKALKMAGLLGVGVAVGGSLLASTPEGRDALAELVKAFAPVVDTLAGVVRDLTPAIADFAKWVAEMVGKDNKGGGGQSVLSQMSDNLAYTMMRFNGASPEIARATLIGTNLDRNARDQNKYGTAGLAPVPKGTEEVDQSFWRILEASTKMDLQKNIADSTAQTATNTAQMEGRIQELLDLFRRFAPPGVAGALGF